MHFRHPNYLMLVPSRLETLNLRASPVCIQHALSRISARAAPGSLLSPATDMRFPSGGAVPPRIVRRNCRYAHGRGAAFIRDRALVEVPFKRGERRHLPAHFVIVGFRRDDGRAVRLRPEGVVVDVMGKRVVVLSDAEAIIDFNVVPHLPEIVFVLFAVLFPLLGDAVRVLLPIGAFRQLLLAQSGLSVRDSGSLFPFRQLPWPPGAFPLRRAV